MNVCFNHILYSYIYNLPHLVQTQFQLVSIPLFFPHLLTIPCSNIYNLFYLL